MSHKIFTVEDSFVIKGRGIVLTPGIQMEKRETIKVGDKIMMRKPDGTNECYTISGIEWPHFPNNTRAILISGLQKEDIPIGTEAWTIDE